MNITYVRNRPYAASTYVSLDCMVNDCSHIYLCKIKSGSNVISPTNLNVGCWFRGGCLMRSGFVDTALAIIIEYGRICIHMYMTIT